MSITPTPIPPGARTAAEALADHHAAQTRSVAIALIGTGCEFVSGAWDRAAMARDVAEALGLIPTAPGRPNRSTSAERAMRATSRKAKR